MKFVYLSLAIALLCACRAPTIKLPVAENSCGAERFEQLIGRHIDEVRDQLPPEGPKLRILYPNTPATMDLRPDRLNVILKEDGTIDDFSCV